MIRLLLALLFFCSAATATVAAIADPIALYASDSVYDLSEHSYVLEDADHRITFAEIVNSETAHRFELKAPNRGFITATAWFRFTVRNADNVARTWWFDTGNRTLQTLNFYADLGDKAPVVQSVSSHLPFAARPLRTTDFVFPLEIPPHKMVTIYLETRASAPFGVAIAPRLWLPQAYTAHVAHERDVWFLYVGSILTLGALNLILWVFLRDVQYGLYVASLLGYFVMISFSQGTGGFGVGYQVLLPDSPTFLQLLWASGIAFGVAVPAYFISSLLNFRHHLPKTQLFIHFITVMAVFSTLPNIVHIFTGYPGLAWIQKTGPLEVFFLFCVLTAMYWGSIKAVRMQVPYARYAVAAYTPYVINGAVQSYLYATTGDTVQSDALVWVSVFEMLVMAVALADRFYRERTQKLEAQAEAIAVLQRSEQELEGKVDARTSELQAEKSRTQDLLHNILPADIAAELSTTGTTMPVRHESATVLFTDFSGFTQVASTMPADRMVAELNEVFAAFDDICDEEGVEKIKTIGDAYMAAAGLPKPCPDHAQRCVRAGLRMAAFVEQRNTDSAFKWRLRVGIHSGPVIAGVVGKRKYAFDIWGDTVNIASRMESSGGAGRVNVSAYTYDLIRKDFACEYRGRVDAKGKGEVDMYFVEGTKP